MKRTFYFAAIIVAIVSLSFVMSSCDGDGNQPAIVWVGNASGGTVSIGISYSNTPNDRLRSISVPFQDPVMGALFTNVPTGVSYIICVSTNSWTTQTNSDPFIPLNGQVIELLWNNTAFVPKP